MVATMENITTPARRALAALDKPAPGDGAAGMPRRISKTAIDLMVSGECKKITEAAEKVGLARESLSRALSKPHIAEHMRTKVVRSLAMASARAGATKIDLLDGDAVMRHSRFS
jgi:hypothetical protein